MKKNAILRYQTSIVMNIDNRKLNNTELNEIINNARIICDNRG